MLGADPDWARKCVTGGLASGGGLIESLKDDPEGTPRTDKRCFVVEPEFAKVLTVASRDGSTLSPIIRQAWDGDTLEVKTRNKPAKATGASVSIMGHITHEELRR